MDPTLAALVGLIREGGPWALVAVFAILWWRADQERRDVQAKLDATGERAINAINDTGNAIGDMRVLLGAERQRRQP